LQFLSLTGFACRLLDYENSRTRSTLLNIITLSVYVFHYSARKLAILRECVLCECFVVTNDDNHDHNDNDITLFC